MNLKIQLMKDETKLCSFEKLKEWKTGFSVKCPKSTSVTWVNDDDKVSSFYHTQTMKRTITCPKCIKEFNEAIVFG